MKRRLSKNVNDDDDDDAEDDDVIVWQLPPARVRVRIQSRGRNAVAK